jgi:hypothetical protein
MLVSVIFTTEIKFLSTDSSPSQFVSVFTEKLVNKSQ